MSGWQAMAGAMTRTELSMASLFARYIGLGGVSTAALLADHVGGGGSLSQCEHDLAVLAINERFLEMNLSDRLPYLRDDAPRWRGGG